MNNAVDDKKVTEYFQESVESMMYFLAFAAYRFVNKLWV
jgi:hypothetical protein